MLVQLTTQIVVAGVRVGSIELRPPGRKLFEVMRLDRGPVRFSEAAVVRFAARLSGHGTSTIGKLNDADFVQVATAIEELYAHARRRFAVRTALTDNARATARAARESEL